MNTKTAVVNIEAFRHLTISRQGKRKTKSLLDLHTWQTTKVLLRILCAFSVLVLFSKIRSWKPGCAPFQPHICARLLVFDETLGQPVFAVLNYSVVGWVLLPWFKTQPNIFAVMNCCVIALNVFSSDILTWSAHSLYSVQWPIK